ncbi:MAG: hypothetical protein LBJ44_07275 [Propionibacteriaceae bacterium]|jgi:hypothetical protein|nr:hypothetical protein [Propionibacteriaceae bacterium]
MSGTPGTVPKNEPTTEPTQETAMTSDTLGRRSTTTIDSQQIPIRDLTRQIDSPATGKSA